MNHSTLAVLGGTGRVGQKVVEEGLRRGHHLRVLARNAGKVAPHERVTVVQGDARDERALRELLDGAVAVVSTLGPSGVNTSLKAAKESALEEPCSNSTRVLLPLMKDKGIRRFVLTGGASLSVPGDQLGWLMRFMLHRVAPTMLGKVFTDRERELELLQSSDVDWTIARCARMDDATPPGPLRHDAHRFVGGRIHTQLLEHISKMPKQDSGAPEA